MARWPQKRWTTLFTYVVVLVLFPLLCLVTASWVGGCSMPW